MKWMRQREGEAARMTTGTVAEIADGKQGQWLLLLFCNWRHDSNQVFVTFDHSDKYTQNRMLQASKKYIHPPPH